LCKDKKINIFLIIAFSGKLTLPPDSKDFFFLYAVRNEDGDFEFKDGLEAIEVAFNSLKLAADDESEYCVSAKFDKTLDYLKLYESDCNRDNATVCRMWKNEQQDCTVPFVKKVGID
jgi:hypothetical protein